RERALPLHPEALGLEQRGELLLGLAEGLVVEHRRALGAHEAAAELEHLPVLAARHGDQAVAAFAAQVELVGALRVVVDLDRDPTDLDDVPGAQRDARHAPAVDERAVRRAEVVEHQALLAEGHGAVAARQARGVDVQLALARAPDRDLLALAQLESAHALTGGERDGAGAHRRRPRGRRGLARLYRNPAGPSKPPP